MKTMTTRMCPLALAGILMSVTTATSAAVLEWDDNTATAGIQQMGGNRQWTTGTPATGNWTADGGATHQNWNNANNDTARISFGTEREMQLQTAITVDAIEVQNNHSKDPRRLDIKNDTLTLTSGQIRGKAEGSPDMIQLFSKVSGDNGLEYTKILLSGG